MTQETGIAIYEPQPTRALIEFNEEQIQLLKDQFGRDLSDSQFHFAIELCRRTGLNPMANQIHFIPRKNRVKGPNGNWTEKVTLTVQTGIDGYRLIGHRTREVAGTDGPYWRGKETDWQDYWDEDEPPVAAKFGVRRLGMVDYTYHVATYREYVQMVPNYDERGNKNGTRPNDMWARMPANQLAKCAEAGAWRKAFPQELSGIFTDAEGGASEIVAQVQEEREAEAPAPRQIARPQARSKKEAAPAPAPRKPQPEAEPFDSEDEAALPFEPEDEPIQGQARELPPEPTPQPAAAPDAAFGAFWNELQELMETLGKDVRDLGMVLNTAPSPMGVKAWWKANAGTMTDPVAYCRNKLLTLG